MLAAAVLAAPANGIAQDDEPVPESYAASGAGLPPAWTKLHRAFFELTHDAPNRAAQSLLEIREDHARSPASHLACSMLDSVARHRSVDGRPGRGCRPSDPPPARHAKFVVQNPDWVHYRDAFEALAADDTDRSARMLAELRDRRSRHPTTPLAEELLEALERTDAEPPPREKKSLATRRKEFAGPVGEPPPLPPPRDEKSTEDDEARADGEEPADEDEEDDAEQAKKEKEKGEGEQPDPDEERTDDSADDGENDGEQQARAKKSEEGERDEPLSEPIDDPDARGFDRSRPPLSKRLALMTLGSFLGALIGMSTNALIGAALGEVVAGPYSTGPGAAVGAFAGLALTPPLGAFIAGENMGGNGKLWASYLGFFLGTGAGLLLGAASVAAGPAAGVLGVIVAFTLPWLGSAVGYELTDSNTASEED